MVEGKRRAILDDVVLGVGADEVVHASLDATYAGAPNLRCPSASNAHEESTMNETQDVDVLNQAGEGCFTAALQNEPEQQPGPKDEERGDQVRQWR